MRAIVASVIQTLNAPVSVILAFDHKARTVRVKKILYDGREYLIKKIGYHFPHRAGRTLYHVFGVVSDSLYFKLVLNTETLHWTVAEIHDHEGNVITV